MLRHAQEPREWGVQRGEGCTRSEEQQGPVPARPGDTEDSAIILSQLAAGGEYKVGGASPHRVSRRKCVRNSLRGVKGEGRKALRVLRGAEGMGFQVQYFEGGPSRICQEIRQRV